MGDGQKHEDVTYFPVQPPTIMEDPSERDVNEEPNPFGRKGELMAIADGLAKGVEYEWARYDTENTGSLNLDDCFKFMCAIRDSIAVTTPEISAEGVIATMSERFDPGSPIPRGEIVNYLKQHFGLE